MEEWKEMKIDINVVRSKILKKGFANISDIRKFIPCGYERARLIYEQECLNAHNEGKKTTRGISAKRLAPYVYLSVNEIHKYAEKEKEVYSNE